MKKLFILVSILLFNIESFANANCFIAKENGAIIQQEGTCTERHSPASTFKIAISLMGYNENILVADTPHDMAQKIVLLYNNKSLWEFLQKKGKQFVESEHSPDRTLQLFKEIL